MSVRLTATIDPGSRVVQWCEAIEVTAPGDAYRRWRPGRVFSRVIVPVPNWLARLAFRLGVRR